MNKVTEAVSKIKPGKYGGSSVHANHMYHNLPFGELSKISSHRGGTQERVNKILQYIDVKGKTILDLGCSVGGISMGLAQEGAEKVTGVDYDPESINVAKGASKHLGLNNVEFKTQTIDESWAKESKEVDVLVWLSHWMWIVKQLGIDKGLDILYLLSSKAKEMVFESAAGDGMGKIEGATQEDIKKWLYQNTGFENIENIGAFGGWMGRNVFICKDNQMGWSGTTSEVERTGRNTIRKTFKKEYHPEICVTNEVEALKRLENEKGFPRLTDYGKDFIEVTYAGRPVKNLSKDKYFSLNPEVQYKERLNSMMKYNIIHRDIKPENFLYLNGTIYIVDFSWAVFDGDLENTYTPHETLGMRENSDSEWNDERDFKRSHNKICKGF